MRVVDRRETLKALVALLVVIASRRSPAALTATAASADPAALAPVNLFEYEPLARQRLSQMAYDYIAGGAADEITLRRNRESFDALRLKPRVLVDVSALDTRLELFGQRFDFPILIAPTANHRLAHPEGELATARGAGAAGATMVVSTFASRSLEEIARSAATPLWFQLYTRPDRGFTRNLIQRAEAAGCKVVCITVDTPVVPARDRERRAGLQWPSALDPTLTWDTITWIRSFARVPIVIKGILAPEDARLAADHGAAGVLVSNHGGRNLDTTPATIQALPAVVEALAGRLPVLLDGGVRRGTDVVKALALGARAVLIGRPPLWGLAVDGASGVQRVIEILKNELTTAMALCGTPSLGKIGPDVLWREK